MRLIEQQMCRAVSNREDWRKDNTSVTVDVNGFCHVYLHGNKIAEIGNDSLTILDGGWRTNTTKSRLNALINGLCDGYTQGVYQKDFVWYIKDDDKTVEFENGYNIKRV